MGFTQNKKSLGFDPSAPSLVSGPGSAFDPGGLSCCCENFKGKI